MCLNTWILVDIPRIMHSFLILCSFISQSASNLCLVEKIYPNVSFPLYLRIMCCKKWEMVKLKWMQNQKRKNMGVGTICNVYLFETTEQPVLLLTSYSSSQPVLKWSEYTDDVCFSVILQMVCVVGWKIMFVPDRPNVYCSVKVQMMFVADNTTDVWINVESTEWYLMQCDSTDDFWCSVRVQMIFDAGW